MSRSLDILVVDDEQVVLDSVKKHLRKENYSLVTVLSAEEGLDILNDSVPDIILTDLMMPEIDGLEFMKIVKNKYPQIPIVMITGYATINTALQATQLGAFDYIAKPFTKSELISVVQRAADLVLNSSNATNEKTPPQTEQRISSRNLRNVGDHVWIMVEDDGFVRMGIDRSFLHAIGKIQNIFLPSVGDELRQGSKYLQIFSSDLRSHTVLSPLSGIVTEVNNKLQEEPKILIEDPFGEGWLIRLKPSKFDFEISELGL
jgi:CheY-like chemotaxis protein/glycine cleavage system H lipoate-binding protein